MGVCMYVKYCPDNRFANSPKQIKFPALIGQILSPILDTDNSLSQKIFITLCLNEPSLPFQVTVCNKNLGEHKEKHIFSRVWSSATLNS